MNAIFWGFLLWLLISNHYLRMMIKDAYRYKKTNQQVREFENWYFSGEKNVVYAFLTGNLRKIVVHRDI